MCSNDMTAIGVLHKAYRAGLRVPDDLSIIGFDNIHMRPYTISTIQNGTVRERFSGRASEAIQFGMIGKRTRLKCGATTLRVALPWFPTCLPGTIKISSAG